MNRRLRRIRPWVMVAALATVVACDRGPSDPTVALRTSEGREVLASVEIADTPDERRAGLMYRTDLGPDEGMLFLFEQEGDRSFWMKNTPTSLDIFFIGADRRIVGIRKNTEPYSEKPIRVDAPSQAVLEVPAGFAERHGIEPGARVEYRNVESPLLPRG